ncbi:MAG: flagellar biosynthesis protein FlhB [Synergistaceae bacterium]|jgi:flagellar biosynthetic protein FlhB|nr:flagellar biosynthesis protein FlhB [Synergistaceae bacterium]
MTPITQNARVRAFDLQFFAGEKTEQATPRRRNKARDEGQMARSQDLSAAVVIVAGLLGIYLLALFTWGRLIGMFESVMAHLASDQMFGNAWWALPLDRGFRTFFAGWLPIGLLCALSAILIMLHQVGFKIISEPFRLKFNKFNPVSGMKKIISAKSLVELAKGIAKASILMWVLYDALRKEQALFLSVMMFPIEQGVAIVMKKIWALALRMAIFLLIIGLIDYAYQKWSFSKSIRMSKQEIKDEYKQMEGDPMIKRRIRQKQRELARSRMMSDVPKADVVVTNPTQIAVAVQYDSKSMIAPIVLAKGRALLAKKIREIAEENNIPVIENKPLARALMAQVDVGEPVPQELYRAVAEVLAFIYRLKEGRTPGKPQKNLVGDRNSSSR